MALSTMTHFNTSDDKRPGAILVFGEHAREVIGSELALWLARALAGDANTTLLTWPQVVSALREAGLLQLPATPPDSPDTPSSAPPGSSKEHDAATAVAYWSQYILSRLQLYVLPIENPDGRVLLEGGELCRRKTRTGVDLNRNWPYAWQKEPRTEDDTYGGPAPFSEPHARVLRDLAVKVRPKSFINVHSGEWAVYTPWDSRAATAAGLPADLDALVSTMGRLCNCQAGPAGAVSSYLAFGTSMDWFWTQLGTPYPLTLELYGSGSEGKLKAGQANKALGAWPVEAQAGVAPPGAARARGHHLHHHQRVHSKRGRSVQAAGEQAGFGGRSARHHARALREAGLQPAAAVNGSAVPQQRRRLQAGPAVDTSEDKVLSKVKAAPAQVSQCFAFFNPMSEPEYREVVGRWFAILMYTLRHVADPAHPGKPTIQSPGAAAGK
uniref:Peptidase M14 domain-containing protein n=1 Tax=Chlamydomonas leiostraca TaxID=1034604 RepID=A0A7S0WFA8_9CHLO